MPLFPRPPAPTSLIVDLARIVGAQGVSTQDGDRLAYARDAWPRDLIRVRGGEIPAAPSCVVWPESAMEVAKVLELAARVHVPVVPYGAGSGVAGGARPTEGGIILDLKRMRSIRRLDEKNLRAEVEAGIIGERLERLLNDRGYTLGHFPSSIVCSTVGGWLAARSAGQMSTLYGKIEDIALGLEVVTPGRVRRAYVGPRPASGPGWNALVMGSEGTLAAITAAELRIRPLPAARDLRGFRFPDVKAGLDAIRLMLRANLRPAVVRLYDALDTLLGRGHGQDDEAHDEVRSLDNLLGRTTSLVEELSKKLPGFEPGSKLADRIKQSLVKTTVRAVLGAPLVVSRAVDVLPDDCLLILGFEGQPAIVGAEAALARELCTRAGAVDLGPGPGEHWLKNRYNVSFKQSKIYASGAFVDTMEVASTWDRLLPMYKGVKKAISKDALVLAHFSHAYNEGCSIYFSFAGTAPDPARPSEALERYDRIWKNAIIAVHEAGGTMSHHHGVGELKAAGMAREHGPGGMRLLSGLKSAFDPAHVLNPNKLGLEPLRRPLARSASRIPLREKGFPKEIAATVGERNIFTSGARTTVRPPDESALAAVLRVAQPRSIAVVTDQTGFRAPPGAVNIDLSRFEGIARFSEHSLFVEVEAGVTVERLERLIGSHGMTLGHVHPRAVLRTVGAAIARNLLVRRSTAFGDLGDLCFAVRGLLANGAPVETRPVPRSATGPELDRAFVAAQGRLGIITKATLRIAMLPKLRDVLAFEMSTLGAAIECARLVLHRGVRPAAARVIGAGPAIVAVELVAPNDELMRAQAAIVSSAAAQTGGTRLDDQGYATGGRFDAIVETTTTWPRAEHTLESLRSATDGDVWLDFLAPEGVSIVTRVADATMRRAAAEAAVQAGGRVVAGLPGAEPEGDQPAPSSSEADPYDDVLRALTAALDPTGVFRERA